MARARRQNSFDAGRKGELLATLLTSEELRRWARTAKSGALSTRRSELNRARHYPPVLALTKLSRIDKMLSRSADAAPWRADRTNPRRL